MKRLVFGLASFALAAPSIVFAGPPARTGWTAGYDNARQLDLPGGTVYNIISSLLSWLLGILGFIAIMGFVISGIMYLTSAGDEGQAEKAKNAMKYSIIGVIVGLVGWVAVQAIDRLLAASFF